MLADSVRSAGVLFVNLKKVGAGKKFVARNGEIVRGRGRAAYGRQSSEGQASHTLNKTLMSIGSAFFGRLPRAASCSCVKRVTFSSY